MREIAIVGLGGGMGDAPTHIERWGLPWSGDSSYDLYFEIHADNVRPYTQSYKDKLAGLEVPVMMQKEMEGIPNSECFPTAAIGMIGSYLESSIAYMLAFAIFEEVDKINIYGVGAPFDSHYVAQRSNLEYLIGFARASGIEVEVQDCSELLQSHWDAEIYGFDKANLRPGTEHVT